MKPGSVAKSAVISFGTCLRTVIESPNLSEAFKVYILDMVLQRYGKVVERDDMKRLYEMSVVKGCDKYGDRTDYEVGMRKVLAFVSKDSLYMEPGHDLCELLMRSM